MGSTAWTRPCASSTPSCRRRASRCARTSSSSSTDTSWPACPTPPPGPTPPARPSSRKPLCLSFSLSVPPRTRLCCPPSAVNRPTSPSPLCPPLSNPPLLGGGPVGGQGAEQGG